MTTTSVFCFGAALMPLSMLFFLYSVWFKEFGWVFKFFGWFTAILGGMLIGTGFKYLWFD